MTPRPFQICTACHRVRIWHELEITGPAEKRGRAMFDGVTIEMRQCGADGCRGTMARVVTDEPEAEPQRRAVA